MKYYCTNASLQGSSPYSIEEAIASLSNIKLENYKYVMNAVVYCSCFVRIYIGTHTTRMYIFSWGYKRFI